VAIPLLPGTRAIYSTSCSCLTCVGFLGYAGGFDASAVRDDNDLASTTCEDIAATNCDQREKQSEKNGETESLLKSVGLLLFDKETGGVVRMIPVLCYHNGLHMPDEAGLKMSLRGQRVLWLCNSDWLFRPRPT
jgi:hypothetical protein